LLFIVPLVVVVLLALAALVAAWIGSNRVYREGMRHELPRHPIRARVLEVGADSVVLRAVGKRRLKTEGTWALSWLGGTARVTCAASEVGSDGGEPSDGVRYAPKGGVRYALGDVRGELAVGDECELDAALELPREGAGAPVEVSYPTPLGEYPGRFVAGSGSTWLVVVHGQSNTTRVRFRLLDAVGREPAPKLAVSYRGDPGTPPTEDGNFHFGRTEWEDLEAGVQYALDQGASRVVLVAESIGGAVALWFMRNSRLADCVDGLFLDAPMLDFQTAVTWTGATTGFPKPLIWLGRVLAARRFSIDWSRYDARPILEELSVPVLIVHGDRDGQIPVALSIDAATANPGAVRVEWFASAGHCQSWNVDPERYDVLLSRFVREARSVPELQPVG